MTMISENIKRLRKAKKLSQKRLAHISGVSFRTIQNVEAEISDSGASALAALSDSLGVTIDELVRGNMAHKNSKPTVEEALKVVREALAVPGTFEQICTVLSSVPTKLK